MSSGAWEGLLRGVVLAAFGGVVYLLLFTPLRRRRMWRAALTPLASIIGSGFLVVAPLLYFIVGDAAPLAMLLIVGIAYLIGEAIRFNIRYEEPLLEDGSDLLIQELETISSLLLSFAYVISVAFYVRLMASFVLEGMEHRPEWVEDMLATAVLLFIGLSGFWKGLDKLESLEEYAVSIKLAVIAAALVGFAFHDAASGFALSGEVKPFSLDTLRYLGGILLVVQGFETSKYLGRKYSAAERIRTMKWAQGISGAIYVGFIAVVLPLLYLLLGRSADETAIIELSRQVSEVLAYLLVAGAVMSQFSAAVADTIGAGGLLAVETKNRLRPRTGYLLITVAATVLVWRANIFEIITYASRAFAAYYLVQVVIAWVLARRRGAWHQWLFAFDAVVLGFIVLLGKPVG